MVGFATRGIKNEKMMFFWDSEANIPLQKMIIGRETEVTIHDHS